MADAAVDFLLENLERLLSDQRNFFKHEKNQVKTLEEDLLLFRSFLRGTIRTRRQDESLRELVRQIRDIVYEAEDLIDVFITQANDISVTFRSPVFLQEITNRVQAVAGMVKDIYGVTDKHDFDALNIANEGNKEKSEEQPPRIRHEDVVGFDDEAGQIIGYLLENRDQLDVISVIGMPGLGKTTLVRKIFDDERIQREFPTHRIWIYVSQEFTKKDIYLAILEELNRDTKDMHKKSLEELAEIVKAHLRKIKFLIVMDDVCTAKDWEEIHSAFPESNTAACKVLVTSCEGIDPHARANLSLVSWTQEKSWSLLQLEVFGPKLGCPPELEVIGRLIAERCKGLPLSIVVIGGILAKKLSQSDNMSVKMVAWTNVLNSISKMNEDPQKRLASIIVLSYNELPYHLRACFLYLGMFPGDFEIPVSKLIRMWIAEGFIQRKDGISLEKTAENYLDELINWSLVKVDKRGRDGRVKTCRIHHMLHDFCKNEAGNERENFLQEIKSTPEGFAAQISRRICIHSKVLKFVSSKPSGLRIRSFTCFAKGDISLPAENTSAIPDAFKLLRVLDIKPVKFTEIPRDMYQLVHLRYISLSLNAGILPEVFAKLWNIETLTVDTTYSTLHIKADIWQLSQLRHFKTNASAILPEAGKSSKEGENLQTLGTISPKSCTIDVFDRAPNLKKLGIRGKLSLLLKGKNAPFNSLGRLDSLEKLKLLNNDHPGLNSLSPSNRFPPNLKSLTLSFTFLDWKHMSTLALLESLEVLKLKNKAIMGTLWESTAKGFRCLQVLHINETDLIEWKAPKHHFPKLRCLDLHNCEDLKEIPISLADAPDFQLLDLCNSIHAVASAKKIYEAKLKKRANQHFKDEEFKLSIFPPVE